MTQPELAQLTVNSAVQAGRITKWEACFVLAIYSGELRGDFLDADDVAGYCSIIQKIAKGIAAGEVECLAVNLDLDTKDQT